MEITSNKLSYTCSLAVLITLIIAVFCIDPINAYAIDDVKDCVNPEHYDVEKFSDIKDKKHVGEITDSCISKEDYDKKIQEEYEKWKEVVKEANKEYTKVYNAYEKTLHETVTVKEELSKQDEVISEKFAQYEKAVTATYKQNYQGQILRSLILDNNLTETLNLKKYMDSTLEYVTQASEDLKAERQKKQNALDEVNSHIAKAKEELIEAASHINDTIPSASEDVKDYIDSHGTENFKEGRTLVDRNLTEDWLIDVALYYVGTPYVWGGKSETGADCSGFTSLVYRHAENKEIGVNTSAQYDKLDHIDKDKLERGDVLFMANESNSSQEHVGIYLEGDKYIHNSGTGTLSKVDTGIDYFTCGLRVED